MNKTTKLNESQKSAAKAAVLAAGTIPATGFEFEGVTIPYATCRNWIESNELEKIPKLQQERITLISQALELEKKVQDLKNENLTITSACNGFEKLLKSEKERTTYLTAKTSILENEVLTSMEFVANLENENLVLESENDNLKSQVLSLKNKLSCKTGFLKDRFSVLIIFILFLAANVYHNASGYTSIVGESFNHWLFAIIIVVSIDLAVLVFTVHGMKKQAAFYAIGTFVVTFLHFNPDICPYSDNIISFIFAADFSYGIWSFSELFKEKI